ncbi:hypothetical protein VP01_4319g1 [Puccinia sorghi]|uniref:Uncharacterized protein n=1 Tax=Puccinia sorghi TaxID=27349 RepID=A0A0L6UQ18_9BASI|nr:hypothetical protein VP01_4319g1 [Puccinia sorghi]
MPLFIWDVFFFLIKLICFFYSNFFLFNFVFNHNFFSFYLDYLFRLVTSKANHWFSTFFFRAILSQSSDSFLRISAPFSIFFTPCTTASSEVQKFKISSFKIGFGEMAGDPVCNQSSSCIYLIYKLEEQLLGLGLELPGQGYSQVCLCDALAGPRLKINFPLENYTREGERYVVETSTFVQKSLSPAGSLSHRLKTNNLFGLDPGRVSHIKNNFFTSPKFPPSPVVYSLCQDIHPGGMLLAVIFISPDFLQLTGALVPIPSKNISCSPPSPVNLAFEDPKGCAEAPWHLFQASCVWMWKYEIHLCMKNQEGEIIMMPLENCQLERLSCCPSLPSSREWVSILCCLLTKTRTVAAGKWEDVNHRGNITIPDISQVVTILTSLIDIIVVY